MKLNNIIKIIIKFFKISSKQYYTTQIIKFGEVNKNGIMFNKDTKITIGGKIKKMSIDNNGVKIIESFNIDHISMNLWKNNKEER